MSLIQIKDLHLWSTCLICMSTIVQDKNDMVYPGEIIKMLSLDEIVIEKW